MRPLQKRVRFGILRQIVEDFIPRCAIGDEGVKLRANAGIVIERAHSDRHLHAIGPIAAEQARAAVRAENFHRAFAFAVDFDQLLALQQPKLLALHTRLRANRRAGMFATAFAVAMTRADKRRLDFKPHAAAQTTAVDQRFHFTSSPIRTSRTNCTIAMISSTAIAAKNGQKAASTITL